MGKFWVPIDSGAKRHLPRDRPYTELEAMFCVQCDHYEGNEVTVLGYAELWGWSRKKVRHFLETAGVEIAYPDTASRKKRGQIRGQYGDNKGAIKGTIKGHEESFIFTDLRLDGDNKETLKGQYGDNKGATTIKRERKSLEEEEKTYAPLGAGPCPDPLPADPPSPKKKKATPPNGAELAAFLDGFNSILGTSYRGDTKTARQFRARLAEGSTVEDLLNATRTASGDAFLMGQNDREQRYLTPEYITRPDKLQKWLNANQGLSVPPSVSPGKNDPNPGRTTWENCQRVLAEMEAKGNGRKREEMPGDFRDGAGVRENDTAGTNQVVAAKIGIIPGGSC